MVFLSENKFYKTVKEICAFCVIFRIDLMYFVMDGDFFAKEDDGKTYIGFFQDNGNEDIWQCRISISFIHLKRNCLILLIIVQQKRPPFQTTLNRIESY